MNYAQRLVLKRSYSKMNEFAPLLKRVYYKKKEFPLQEKGLSYKNTPDSEDSYLRSKSFLSE